MGQLNKKTWIALFAKAQLRKFILLSATLGFLYQPTANGETTGNGMRDDTVQRYRDPRTSRGYNPQAYGTLDSSSVSGTPDIEIRNEYAKLKEFYQAKNRRERYAFINKYNRRSGNFLTYVVDMRTGRVADKFVSLVGYGGIGCGRGQTRPGIFRLSSARGTGASRKPWWGNNYSYQVMTNIGGHSSRWGGNNCGLNSQHVAHSNRNMSKMSANGRRRSAGCFVTSPDMFDKWTKRVAGDALIYNVKP